MSVHPTIRYASGIAILDLRGRLTGTADGEGLSELILREFNAGHRAILLNCESLESSDSSGLGDLVATYASVIRQGGQIKLLRPHHRFAELLAVTRLDAVFEIHQQESSAIASFNPATAVRARSALSNYLE